MAQKIFRFTANKPTHFGPLPVVEGQPLYLSGDETEQDSFVASMGPDWDLADTLDPEA